jgi:hypothetical protein
MGIFDRLFGRKDKDSEVKDVGIEKVKKKKKQITTKKSTNTKKKPEKKSTVKPKVEKIILFWLDNIPERRDAQAIADLLPQQMHPELDFETTIGINDKLSGKSILERMNQIITTVSAKLFAAHMEDFDKETLLEMAQQRAMNIAVMQDIEKKLQKKHGFKHVDYPNRLICKFIETTTGLCYYALILDSEIDPSNYDFATGEGGAKLSTIFWEAANTAPD